MSRPDKVYIHAGCAEWHDSPWPGPESDFVEYIRSDLANAIALSEPIVDEDAGVQMQDHQYPWIEVEVKTILDSIITCTRCLQTDNLNNWITFVKQHAKCPCPGRRISMEEV